MPSLDPAKDHCWYVEHYKQLSHEERSSYFRKLTARGRYSAFVELFTHVIIRIIKRLGPISGYSDDDIVQDTLLSAGKTLVKEPFTFRDDPVKLAVRCAQRTHATAIKRITRTRKERQPPPNDFGFEDYRSDHSQWLQLWEELLDAIETELSPEDRAVLQESIEQIAESKSGKPNMNDLAQRLGVSWFLAKSRFARAQKTLLKVLSNKYEWELHHV